MNVFFLVCVCVDNSYNNDTFLIDNHDIISVKTYDMGSTRGGTVGEV